LLKSLKLSLEMKSLSTSLRMTQRIMSKLFILVI